MTDPTGLGSLNSSQSDGDMIQFIARQAINGMATVTLVRIEAVNGDKVDVRPMVHQIDGAGTAIPHGIIHDLPFFTLRAGAAAIRAVPVVGDIGMAAFCHSDTTSVRATKEPAPPPTRRRFDWSDGLYLGGFLGPEATTWIDVIDGTVEIKAATIKLLGDGEVTGALTASGTSTGTTDVVGGGKSLKDHIHSGVTTGSASSGPPA